MAMDSLQLERYLTREALRSWCDVWEDFIQHDKDEIKEVEEITGLSFGIVTAFLRDMVQQWELGQEQVPLRQSLATIIQKAIADAVTNIPPMQATLEQTVTQKVTRTIGQPQYSARRGITGPKPEPHVELLDEKPPINLNRPSNLSNSATYREIVLTIMAEDAGPWRAGDIREVIEKWYPERDMGESTVDSILSSEIAHGRVERVESGLYRMLPVERSAWLKVKHEASAEA